MMRRSHMGLLAGAVAAMSMGASMVALPAPRSDKTVSVDEEKTGRQRKRWLQRQARKQTRKYRK